MATQYDPIAKDASLNTTESPSRNLADVIAQSLAALIAAMPATVLNNLADVVITLPTDGQTLKYDSVSQKWVNADDAGGHTIVDASDIDMPQRASMQFVDAGVSDDAVDDVTKIEIVQEISAESDLNSAPDGVYQGTWDEDVSDVLTADMVGMGDGTGDTVADRADVELNVDVQYTNSNITIAEYFRYHRFGKMVVVDIGGMKTSNTAEQVIATSNLPIMRTRPVAIMFSNRTGSSQDHGFLYAALGYRSFTVSIPNTTMYFYAQFIYFTD